MSLLEAPCSKTSWRALLFRAIFGITGGAYSVFWHMTVQTSQQQWNRFWWPPLWFWSTRAVFNCVCVYEFREVRIRGARRFYFVGALLFRDNVQTHLGRALLIGTLRYMWHTHLQIILKLSTSWHGRLNSWGLTWINFHPRLSSSL